MDPQGKAKVALTFALYQGDELIRRETVAQDIVKVGKDPRSHLRVDDELASRMHAVIEVAATSDITLIDLGNEPGTLVNGQRVNKCKVRPGDQIQIGSTLIVLEAAETAAAGMSAPPAAVASAPPAPPSNPPPAAYAASGAPAPAAENPFAGSAASAAPGANPFAAPAPANPFAASPQAAPGGNPFQAPPANPFQAAPGANPFAGGGGGYGAAVPMQMDVDPNAPARYLHVHDGEERPGREPGRGRGRAHLCDRGHGDVGVERAPRLAPHAAALVLRRRGVLGQDDVRLLHPERDARHHAGADRGRARCERVARDAAALDGHGGHPRPGARHLRGPHRAGEGAALERAFGRPRAGSADGGEGAHGARRLGPRVPGEAR